MTINDLLSNELIQKYFGCSLREFPGHPVDVCNAKTCQKILSAMCEPIREGDKLLGLSGYNERELSVNEDIADNGWDGKTGFHSYWLRLPDQFQKREKFIARHDSQCKCWSVALESGSCGNEVASFFGENAERHAKEHASKLNSVTQEPTATDPVEEKILEIAHDYIQPIEKGSLACRIRELVKLAREGK